MKSYEETISTVFDRVETYRTKQKRNRRIVLSAVIPVCLTAVCITGFWIHQGRQSTPPSYTPETPTAPVSMDSTTTPTNPANTDSTTAPTNPADKIIINPLGDISEQIMGIARHRKDEILMTLGELSQYYGTDIIPDVPDNLTRREGETYKIYKRDNGTGEIYWDQNRQDFFNEDNSKKIIVDTRKGALPFYDFVILDPETESSIINGVEVTIGLNEYGWYSAWFMYQNTGFFIGAEGITGNELVAVIKSLTD